MAKDKEDDFLPKGFKDTSEVKVPESLIEQVVGQDNACQIIKKAAEQKRNVLLIGTPGTGKSMLAQAMSELLPTSELEDILVVSNPDDENVPKVITAKAGEGRKIVEGERFKARATGGNLNLVMIVFLLIASFFLLFFGRKILGDIITAAMLIGLFVISGVVMLGTQLGRGRILVEAENTKVIVDNTGKTKAPFCEATGARAGALLGDVRHDPFQCFTTAELLQKQNDGWASVKMKDFVDEIIQKYPTKVERNEEGYEGVILPENEEAYILGFKDGEAKPVRVLCVNRRPYSGKINSVTGEGRRLSVTPEHKICVNGEFVEAYLFNKEMPLTIHSLPIITSENVIKTFSEQDQISAKKYYEFKKIKQENPTFGYKKIAKIIGAKEGQTRWWNNNTFKPIAVRTVERLEKRGLLPFYVDNEYAPLIARILGTTLGDGGIAGNLNNIFLSSSEDSSLKEYEEDFTEIFGENARNNFDTIKSGVNGTGKCLRNTNRDAIRFFIALGACIGRKNKELRIPAWIYQSEIIQKEFFGALFGNELGSPRFSEKTHKIQDFSFSVAGTVSLKENRINYLKEIEQYLNSYGIKTSKNVYQYNYRNDRFAWKLWISTEIENVSRFAQLIPIRYSNEKAERLRMAVERASEHKVESASKLYAGMRSDNEVLQTLHISKNMLQLLKQKEKPQFNDDSFYFNGTIYNITTESGNLFANGILASNSGGLGTPPHLRVEAGFVHKANKGVLFIDETSALPPKAQQELLTAMQEKKYAITGQSEMSSGAMVRTEPVPCDFILIAAGNFKDLRKMHPALRSRVRGYGYEVFMDDTMEDNVENKMKLVKFIAQEVKKDKKIPHFSKEAVLEVIKEARKRAGRKKRLSLKLRELGGLVRAAGDVAHAEKTALVSAEHVEKAKKLSRTLEQQAVQQMVDVKKEYQVFSNEGAQIGKVNGLAVMGDSGIVLPIVAEVVPSASREEGRIIATGKLGEIAQEAVQNVSAIIKKHLGKDVSTYDIHIQFLQTYEGVEGDSASVSVATAVISALEEVPVMQEVAMTGSLSVRGEVLPIGGATQKTESAIEAGMKKILVPQANAEDIQLEEKDRKKIEIIPVKNFQEVLQQALKEGKEKRELLKNIEKESE